jgi:hypothetical protein
LTDRGPQVEKQVTAVEDRADPLFATSETSRVFGSAIVETVDQE